MAGAPAGHPAVGRIHQPEGAWGRRSSGGEPLPARGARVLPRPPRGAGVCACGSCYGMVGGSPMRKRAWKERDWPFPPTAPRLPHLSSPPPQRRDSRPGDSHSLGACGAFSPLFWLSSPCPACASQTGNSAWPMGDSVGGWVRVQARAGAVAVSAGRPAASFTFSSAAASKNLAIAGATPRYFLPVFFTTPAPTRFCSFS